MIELKSPEVERNLVLSTGHMTKQDSKILEAAATGNQATGLIVYSSECWFLVYCFQETAINVALREGYISKDLHRCLRIGNAMGCTFVKFDRDGPSHDELPSHDW